MDQSIAHDLSHGLKSAYLVYFSPKSAPQVWGIISRVNETSSLSLISKTRKKLHSVRNSTDKYESSAAIQSLKVMDVFEQWLRDNKADVYLRLQEY